MLVGGNGDRRLRQHAGEALRDHVEKGVDALPADGGDGQDILSTGRLLQQAVVVFRVEPVDLVPDFLDAPRCFLLVDAEIAQDILDLEFLMESGRAHPALTRFEGPITVAMTGDVPATAADTTALEAWTGFKPNTPVREGVARFVAWYRDYYRV